jgi:DNA-directed RNA polymerase subunit omega
MILPLDKLISDDSNVYELTCASIRRAAQITLAGDEEIAENDSKLVSVAIKQVLTKKVEYRLEQQS